MAAAAAAAAADGHRPAREGGGATPLQQAAAFRRAFWKFLRPHTIRGTILGSAAVTARALIECPIVSLSSSAAACLYGMSTCRGNGSSGGQACKPEAVLCGSRWTGDKGTRPLLGVLAMVAGNGYIVGVNQTCAEGQGKYQKAPPPQAACTADSGAGVAAAGLGPAAEGAAGCAGAAGGQRVHRGHQPDLRRRTGAASENASSGSMHG